MYFEVTSPTGDKSISPPQELAAAKILAAIEPGCDLEQFCSLLESLSIDESVTVREFNWRRIR